MGGKIHLTYKGIFLASFCVLLISRILVLIGDYTLPISPVALEIVYIAAAILLMIVSRGGKIRISRGAHWHILGMLLIHTILWGTVFVNRQFTDLIVSNFKSQVMYVVIVCITVLAVQQFDANYDFLKCSYYTLAGMLAFYFIKNISELDLSNLANIMSLSDRTRANFGFGHYNTLGAACVCGILLHEAIKKDRRTFVAKIFDCTLLVIMVCMLLACASRSALTSLVVYFVAFCSWKMDEWPIKKSFIRLIKVIRNFLIFVIAVWVLLEVDFMELLVQAQRTMIFTHALPMFFVSGKTWFGLGYASNAAYATRQTPYITYWLDNAYAYYLITTGIVGFSVIMIAFIVLGLELRKRVDKPLGREIISVYVVYAYISLFECTLFSSGAIVNYIYVPWLLSFIMNKRDKRKLCENIPSEV